MTFMDIRTARLVLRRLGPDDAAVVFEYRHKSEVARYQMWAPTSIDDTRVFLAQLAAVAPDTPGTWLQLAIVRRADGRLMGDCGLRFPEGDTRQAEVGITLAPPYHGQGYAAEALRAMLGYLFDVLGKHRVYATMDPRNHSSIALVERVGLRREGHFHKSVWCHGEWADDLVYAMLEDEWRERQKEP
jgi:RimJ/RimL family protein N-acetyltransferase